MLDYNDLRYFSYRSIEKILSSKLRIFFAHKWVPQEVLQKRRLLWSSNLRHLAERKGFEPLCDCSQTDFESAPLWPLRYLSVYVHPRKRGKQSLFNFLENPLDKPVRKIINRAKTQQNQGFSAVFGGTTTQMRTWFRVQLVTTTSIRFHV